MLVAFIFTFFFFFQAEDGIRDGRVTGVQTCALPILECQAAAPTRSTPAVAAKSITLSIDTGHIRTVPTYQVRTFEVIVAQASNDNRSEERRVGKECRYRWGGGDGRKKKNREK